MEELPLDDEHDLPLALASLFHSDIEDSDFDGFMSDWTLWSLNVNLVSK